MTHLAQRDDFNFQNLVSPAHMTFISVSLTKEQSTLILVEADFRLGGLHSMLTRCVNTMI
ncbi:hypothetical protein CpsigB_10020 [Corynebacterium pseudotuberculosis]|uniref:Uncharacterized protein n=1 Tax=Corynebacterium pseudotuberculosis (strain C231) TaxID=681645 RepID=D9Q984_CORP2|nr:hypothetical protein CPC231_03155 [Corynebacterium pseudotuberculosis C231]ADL20520.1 hypothetical protein CP1002_09980 [Corynebacterium pseudotuberculosis 1002]ADO25901.1 hypothetical protein CPI19_08365 [Corynebacterium pseudotuberculosis I19]AEK91961.1 Hypothetical protein CpPAT10_0628 [Corynebacterium pseudotuberculosis PAT10]AEP69884.1 Hypothetical protein Cp4202_0621 [Corynebacterium pseudotuberculosis 42/02-A]AFF21782.1 Hypothetical protein CpP54B96_0638 [Corynebacterium pseudotuberc